MQAWQQVAVTNPQSGFFGQAGYVRRSEFDPKTGQTAVMVKLDTVDEVQSFDSAELRIL